MSRTAHRQRLTTIAALLLLEVTALQPAHAASSYTGSVLYQLASGDGYSQFTLGPQGTRAGGQTVGWGSGSATNGQEQALLWSAPSGSLVNLNPTAFPDFTSSHAAGTDGMHQVGYGYGSGYQHALLWSGTAASAIDLNPTNLAGISDSAAYAVSGAQQVGEGLGDGTRGAPHAMLWSGTAGSAVDLQPTNLPVINGSEALGTDGNHQVGYGAGYGMYHALLWSGTAASAVDLAPTNLTGIIRSAAYGTHGSQQVGYGLIAMNDNPHALLWSGTPDSAVDLNPTNLPGFTSSYANSTNVVSQVGWGSIAGSEHALLWSGTSGSAVDLQALLPATGRGAYSIAFDIDSAGNIYGTAAGTFNGTGGFYAVEWSPVPEPSSLSILVIAGLGLFLRRRRSNAGTRGKSSCGGGLRAGFGLIRVHPCPSDSGELPSGLSLRVEDSRVVAKTLFLRVPRRPPR